MSYIKSSEVSPSIEGSHKRQFSNEDDNTFLPPALSSYSIALLNERTKTFNTKKPQNNITGIYELDFPDRANTLKDRLSVHFKETQSKPEKESASFHDTSASSHHSSLHESQFPLNHTISDDDMEGSISPQNSAFKTPSTASSSNYNNNDLSNSSISSVHTIKKTRGTRRFGKVLGPPKRASRLSDHYNMDTNNSGDPNKSGDQPAVDVDEQLPVPEPKSNLTPNASLNFDPEPVSSSIPGLELSKEKNDEFRERINQQKIENELNFQASRNEHNFQTLRNEHEFQTFRHELQEKYPKQRAPLRNIPVNLFNSVSPDSESDNFRKPKVPKLKKEATPLRYLPGQENQRENPESKRSPPISVPVARAPSPHMPKPPQMVQPTPVAPVKSEEHKKKVIIINGNQYEKLELLGRGGTSKVYKVKALSNNRLYAIKKVTFDQFDEACVKGFKGEIDLLLKLKHSDRVVKLADHAIGEGSIYLVMECGDIDLAHVFQTKLSQSNPLDLQFVKYYSIEILKCVQAVHESGIVHSDLKPANFLFIRGILKIIDFGIANAVPDHTANIYRESQIGTPNYMAPEALVEINQGFPALAVPSNKNTWKVGKPSDVWSCGCIIYQMIYGRPPYGGYSGNQRIMAIMDPQVKIAFPSKGIGGIAVPQSAIELMKHCFCRNPNERWTVEQCLNSDFLKPKIVSENFIRDLVHSAVNYGYNKRIGGGEPITTDVYDTLVDSVLKQIENLNYG